MGQYLILLVVFIQTLHMADFTGRCVGVKDGDTIVMMNGDTAVTIRLADIDCPEKKQAFGQKAKQFTSDAVFGKIVTVKPLKKDKYGRTVGRVFVGDLNVNESLIKAGLAWQYLNYNHSHRLADMEREAHIGLWADSSAVAPWTFRKYKK